ncbi:hypothetical protein KKH23_10895 [Patescibacteria group bacterium]|nr:hypothetical protein [Patescibacteria group bacterium]
MNLIEKIDIYLSEDSEEAAEKMVKNIEKKKGSKYSEEERKKIKDKFIKNMEKMKDKKKE